MKQGSKGRPPSLRPSKICPACGRPFSWRKKWERMWDQVTYCSERCRRRRSGGKTGAAMVDSIIPLALGSLIPISAAAKPAPRAEPLARAVVVIQGGGLPHPFTTPWAACSGARHPYIQALLDAGLPVFTAPGFTNTEPSTAGQTNCPAQPPLELQWNTSAHPNQAGQGLLGFLGYLHATHGIRSFDLVGYSYGGLVARATVAALRQAPPAASMAPAFSYARSAVDAGIQVASIVTLNSPHLGAPAYDIAEDPVAALAPVTAAWGSAYANAAKELAPYQRSQGAGVIQVLRTGAHATADPTGWSARQAGVLDGVSLTLIAGNFCGRRCDAVPAIAAPPLQELLRTDGTVPVYSQLMLPCPSPCPTPPGSVVIPPGVLPAGRVVRRTFPTIHSRFDANNYRLQPNLVVTHNPEAIAYLVQRILAQWKQDGVPLPRRQP